MEFHPDDLKKDLHNAANELKHKVQDVRHDLDSVRVQTSEELEEIAVAINDFNITNLPLVLEFTSDTEKSKDYVSIRRVEYSQLPIVETSSNTDDCYYDAIHTCIPSRLIPEGGIGLLMLPEALGALPKTDELREFIRTLPHAENYIDILENSLPSSVPLEALAVLPDVLSAGRKFNLHEWQIGGLNHMADIALVKNVKGKFYTLGDYHRTRTRSDGTPARRLKEIKIDNQGNLPMIEQTAFWLPEQEKVQKELNKTFGRFYVLHEGSSQKGKQKAPDSVMQLASNYVEATI